MLLRRWAPLGLLLIALVAGAACASEQWREESTFVLTQLEQGDTKPIEFEGKVLVPAEDVPNLSEAIGSADTAKERRHLVADYLTRQKQIDCIVKKLKAADVGDAEIKCEDEVFIDKKDVPPIAEEVRSLGSESAQREFVVSHIDGWREIKQIDGAVERLKQIKNTKDIPLIGNLLDSITRFPIMYRGDDLIPKKDIPALLDQYRAASTDEARRDLVRTYLDERKAESSP